LIAHCRKSMTGVEVPEVVRFVDVLPGSTIRKTRRRGLRNVT
jgi:acyl-coenzyme A synthetase/AMP-(fatty) acid ligase